VKKKDVHTEGAQKRRKKKRFLLAGWTGSGSPKTNGFELNYIALLPPSMEVLQTKQYLNELDAHLSKHSFPKTPLEISLKIEVRKDESVNFDFLVFLVVSIAPGWKEEFCLGFVTPEKLLAENEWIDHFRRRLAPNILLNAFFTSLLHTPRYYAEENAPESSVVTLPRSKKRPWGGHRRAFLQGTSEQRANVAAGYKTLLDFWTDKLPLLYEKFPNDWRRLASEVHSDIPPELFTLFEKKQMKGERLALIHACLRNKVKITKPNNEYVSVSQLRGFRRSGEKILADVKVPSSTKLSRSGSR
jgi:hypothetical protein